MLHPGLSRRHAGSSWFCVSPRSLDLLPLVSVPLLPVLPESPCLLHLCLHFSLPSWDPNGVWKASGSQEGTSSPRLNSTPVMSEQLWADRSLTLFPPASFLPLVSPVPCKGERLGARSGFKSHFRPC